jgi:hypothetical protein
MAFGGPMKAAQFRIDPQDPTSGSGGTSTADTQLQTDLTKLQTDLQAVQDKSQVTPALLAAARNDFQKIQAATTSKPDQTKLATLTADIKSLAGKLPTADQTTQLTADFTAVLESEGVTDQALITQAITDIQAVATASNITADDLSTLAADRAAIEADQASNAPGGSSGPVDGSLLLGGLLGGQTGSGPLGDLTGGGPQGGRFGGGWQGGRFGGQRIG